MTKQDFIDRVAAKTGLSKRDAGKAVNAVVETLDEADKRGDAVRFLRPRKAAARGTARGAALRATTASARP